jgi:hypothetical protein
VIKVSDLTDNTVGLLYTSGDKTTRLARKYAPVVPLMRDLISRPDTPLATEVKTYIAAERIAARLTHGERR